MFRHTSKLRTQLEEFEDLLLSQKHRPSCLTPLVVGCVYDGYIHDGCVGDSMGPFTIVNIRNCFEVPFFVKHVFHYLLYTTF